MPRAGFIVPPRKTIDIYGIAGQVRRALAPLVSPVGRLDLGAMLEWMPEILPGFELEIVEDWEMGEDHGRTWPDHKRMWLRKSVYDGMCRGVGRDRFTVAHECGHLFLHQGVALGRAMTDDVKVYRNSEWQADTFASALLIDEALLRQCRTLEDVAERFGVSLDAARVRFKR